MTDLTITQETLEDRQVLLTVEIPAARVEKAMRSEAARLSKQYRMPGFRPGKAPYNVIINYFGREAVLESLAERMGQDVYREALEAADVTPFAGGSIREITYDPLTYHIVVPLFPEADPGDYRSLRLPFAGVDESAVAAEVEARLQGLREQQRTWVPVERPAAYGDRLTVSLKVTVDDKVVLENDDWDVVPDEEEHTLAPEFDAALVGMTPGEDKQFTLTFPADGDSPWAGQEGHFEVSVKSIKAEEMPELDDAFAQEAGDFETLAAMREAFHTEAEEHLAGHAEEDYRREVLNALVAQATVSYPPAVVENEIELIADEQDAFYKAYGFESRAQVLQLQGITEEAYREQLRPEAEVRVRQRLALDAVVEREQLRASDYELDQYLIENLATRPESLERMRSQLVENELYRAYIISLLLRRKARELLVAIARGEEVPAPGEHPVAEAPVPSEPESEAASQPEAAEDATLADE